ncbi:MAG: hypothetical protein R3E87_10605, partial [Burkholderiaceae bacterium]
MSIASSSSRVRPTTRRTTRVIAALALTACAAPALAIDLDEARVLSRQGQRLKVEIAYASDPGEPVSAVRFSVVAARAEEGSFSPSPQLFTIMQPESSNRVILQSAEVVRAGQIDLVLGLGTQPGRQVLYRL